MTHLEKTSLVPFSQTGDRQPLYVVHGAGGGVLFLEEFGKLLEGTRPVFGFRAHGLDGSSPPDPDVFTMARRYAADLCALDPGPYLLGGYSSGGTIALEMTAHLQSLGRKVDRVILFDAWPTGDCTRPRLVRHLRLLRYLVTDDLDSLRPFLRHITTNRIRSMQPSREVEEVKEPQRDDVESFFERTLDLLQNHPFRSYDVDAVLIKAELNWPALPSDYEWAARLIRPLATRIARGHHITMWWPEYVRDLVDLVEDILAPRAWATASKRVDEPAMGPLDLHGPFPASTISPSLRESKGVAPGRASLDRGRRVRSLAR